jgi:nitrite reductase (NO-forming)
MKREQAGGAVRRENGRGREGPRPGTAPGGAPLRPSQLLAYLFAPALAFLVAGAFAGLLNLVAGSQWTGWIALHLVLLGGVSQLIIGAAQFFAAAFLATDPPDRRLIAGQLACWNSGALLVVIGVPSDLPALTGTGGLLLVAGLGLFAAGLTQMNRRSVQRNHWAIRWYLSAAGCLALGAVFGVLLADAGSEYLKLFGAHLAVNLFGWIGLAIVGTLHTFFPSLAGTRLPFARLEPVAFGLWIAGVLVLAGAMLAGSSPAAAGGWLLLTGAAATLAINLSGCLRARDAGRPAGLPLLLVGTGQLFLGISLMLGLVSVIAEGRFEPVAGSTREALAVLLVGGWFGLTVAGSLLHLTALLARVKSGFKVKPRLPRPSRDRTIVAGAAAGLLLLAGSTVSGLEPVRLLGAALLLLSAAPLVAMLAASAAVAFRPGQAGPGPRIP